MPLEIKNAYEKGSRSYDGKPGSEYWQNTVDYNIKLNIIPTEKIIEGQEEVTYYNNSPDELFTLVIRLYADAYKKGNPRERTINEKDIHDGVEIKDVFINGDFYDLKPRDVAYRNGTNLTINLKNSLKPGEKLTFKASWKQKIPTITKVRTGAYNNTTFLIAFWYPQISVYDDIFGWDKLNYVFTKEFYNNLANFDVEITIPNDYLVWATGTLQNAKDVMPESIYKKYEKAKTSEEVIYIITRKDLKKGFHSPKNTWHYKASDVSDFTIAASNRYLWDAAVQEISGRNVLISSIYDKETIEYMSGHVANQKKMMKHFSEDIPGVPYPYEAFTTFINPGYGGGMEYPMMANNSSADLNLTIHEMFHTYFPMYVRTNEKRWAWMDEGWADYNDVMVEKRFFKNDSDILHAFYDIDNYLGTISDLPLITSSQFLNGDSYYNASYQVPSTVFNILHHSMGDELFLKCYREYIKRWAKKSPTPYDLFYTFENVSGLDLSWLWIPWFFEFGYPDLAIKKFENSKLTVSMLGNKPVPVFVELVYNTGDTVILSKTADIWKDGKKEIIFTVPKGEDIKKITVNKYVADANKIDNYFPTIESLYNSFDLSSKLLGNYAIESYGATVSVRKEKGIYVLRFNEWYYTFYIYPEDETHFKSLDDQVTIIFKPDNESIINSVEIDWGWKLIGKRIN